MSFRKLWSQILSRSKSENKKEKNIREWKITPPTTLFSLTHCCNSLCSGQENMSVLFGQPSIPEHHKNLPYIFKWYFFLKVNILFFNHYIYYRIIDIWLIILHINYFGSNNPDFTKNIRFLGSVFYQSKADPNQKYFMWQFIQLSNQV